MTARARPLALLLAATAEAVVISLVVHLLLDGAGVIGVALPVFVPTFAIVFVGASLATWSARGSELAGPACVIGAVVVGLVIGWGTMQATVISVLVCVVVSLTALWEAVGAGRHHVWLDLAGYVAITLSGALFALQTALGVRRAEAALRLQTPAVYLTLAGVFMLLLSQSSGRRL